MTKWIVLFLSLICNFYLLKQNWGLQQSLDTVKNQEVATTTAVDFKCKEDVITERIVTKTVQEIKYVEIPKDVEPDTAMPPDLKRLLDSAYEDLFPSGEAVRASQTR